MVMEAPTPQCVGLEFVRQYYTILNKAPCHLHRFYANNSSFMHGGENSNREPIIGQSNIHKYIKELNFKDCHAKILLIDSQATMADGVVIQVTGELSNDGRPMRRFMQTFVLAPQSEKKYYVHNDIFRYQDQVFNDDCDGSGEEGPDDVVQHDNGHVEDLQPPPQQQAAVPQEVVVVAPAAAIPGVQESIANPSAGVAAPVVGVSGQQTPQVVNDYGAGPAAAAHHHQAASAAVLASVALPQQPQQVIQSQQGSTTLPSAQALPPQQQQQLNGNISSSPELAAVKPAAVLQQQSSPVVASAAAPMHPHHTGVIPSAPSTAPQPPTSPQASVAPRQASPHLSRQVENMNNSSSPGAAQQSAPQEDSWGSSPGEWDAPAPSQPSRQQQPVSNSRSGVASPPQQATKLTEKTEAAPTQSQHTTTTYAGFFKNSGGSSTSSNTASTTPSSNVQQQQQQQQPASRPSQGQYQPREMAPRSGPHSSSGSQQHRDRNDQQQQGGSHGLHNQQQQQYPRDRDQGNRDGGGFQRTGRGGRPLSYRNRNTNYSESGGDHINAEDGGTNNMENSGYGGGPLEDRRRGPQAGLVPDTHQIFVGNLPQSMHEDELRQVFETYGSIIDVRINIGKGKLGVPSNGKQSGPVPNFGFITFDDEVAVSRCLKDRPIKISGDHRLNVEEKKTKSKVDGGSYNRPSMRPPMHQGGRGGGSFGRGEGRGRGGYNTGPRR